MGILFIGIGLVVGIYVWIEPSEMSREWANCRERLHFEQEQKKREWRKWANKALV